MTCAHCLPRADKIRHGNALHWLQTPVLLIGGGCGDHGDSVGDDHAKSVSMIVVVPALAAVVVVVVVMTVKNARLASHLAKTGCAAAADVSGAY